MVARAKLTVRRNVLLYILLSFHSKYIYYLSIICRLYSDIFTVFILRQRDMIKFCVSVYMCRISIVGITLVSNEII